MAQRCAPQAGPSLRADPIAIVGMACRVPGGGDSPEQLLGSSCATDATRREVPRRPLGRAGLVRRRPRRAGQVLDPPGGFLDRVDGFDAEFFGILPREAERMDPQQRLLLEVAIEALDDAGLPRERLARQRGPACSSPATTTTTPSCSTATSSAIDARTLTGTLHSVLANRLSYLLDLRGPSVSIDTACSSSLVAIHLACQSLRIGRERHGAGRRRVADARARADGRRCRRSASWRRTAAARPSTPAPTASGAARAAAWWCSSASPTRWPTATACSRSSAARR